MRFNLIRKLVILSIFVTPVLFQQGCKKQPKCGCGKDVIFSLTDASVMITYSETSNTAIFYPVSNDGSTYYFCNPGKWIDSLKKLNTAQPILLSGKVYYECNYLYNSGNSYYQMPPVYQVDVTAIKEDNYGKK
jgi:hypothetical protein